MSNPRSPLLYVAIVFVLLTGGYLVWDNYLKQPGTGEVGVNLGDSLLDQEIPSIDGGTVSFSDYEGSILVIDFMAPWCAPCKEQIPILIQVESIPGVEVLTINVDHNYNFTELSDVRDEEDVTWFFGHSPFAAIDYQVSAIPTVVIVDREGLIVYRGFFTTLSDFERVLSPLVG